MYLMLFFSAFLCGLNFYFFGKAYKSGNMGFFGWLSLGIGIWMAFDVIRTLMFILGI